jgi:hypothetical protein
MRFLLRVAIVLLLCLLGIGLYRGWFTFSRSNSNADPNKVNASVSVDKGKIKADVKMAEEKIEEEVKELEGEAKTKETK